MIKIWYFSTDGMLHRVECSSEVDARFIWDKLKGCGLNMRSERP